MARKNREHARYLRNRSTGRNFIKKHATLDDIEELEHWVQIAIRDGMEEARKIAEEKMKPLMGNLGNLGL